MIALIVITVGSGCGLPSMAIKKNRLHYNDVMVETDRSELLLSIVRMRYRDTPEWLVPSSVNVQNSLQSTAAVKPRIVEFTADFLDLAAESRFIETPTVSYTPSDNKFVKAMLAPVTPRTVFLLSYITEDEDVYALKQQIERLPPPDQIQQPREEINLTVRSLAHVLFFFSQGIEVPIEHVKKGQLVMTVDPSGLVFDWQQVLGGLFQVHSCKHKPRNAAVAVKYRGYWFYIDDRDADSKSTFLMLDQLVDLQARVGQSANAPVLTLPVTAGG